MPGIVELTSNILAAIAFLVLGFALLRHRHPTGVRLATVLACFLTAAWAIAGASSSYVGDGLPTGTLVPNLETLRTAGWIIVLIGLQQRGWGLDERPRSTFMIAVALGFIVALQIGLALGMILYQPEGRAYPAARQIFLISRIVVSISGLVLLHNLYQRSSSPNNAGFRVLAVGLGAIFAYDLNLYTLAFLLGDVNEALLVLRGGVNALAAPLIYMAIRNERTGQFMISRRTAFETVSFLAIGAYLILMSLLAYGLRLTGGNWGELLQVIFLAIMLILGALIVLNPKFRARIKVLIALNFYRYRYDYRAEWLRFLSSIDSGAGAELTLRERLIEAIATTLHSPAGALLEPGPDESFVVTTLWHWPALDLPDIPDDSDIVRLWQEEGRIANFAIPENIGPALSRNEIVEKAVAAPSWALERPDIWLGVPLLHNTRLLGVVLLHTSLAPRPLNWEDYNLLRTLGRQGASYLSEAETEARLNEARTFEEYNRRAAFVMHDLKNLVSQLALLARNAERHADNPEFQADMTATLKSSVAKMSDLLKLMNREAAPQAAPDADLRPHADIRDILETVTATARRSFPQIRLETPPDPVTVLGDEAELEAMLTHLVQNAIDASDTGKEICLRLRTEDGHAHVEVADRGHGMSAEFVRDRLFRPFQSTKEEGYGIGVYEARTIASRHGGRLSVETAPDEGTTFRIELPRA